tara:strand:- start:3537 stop:4091 length:555 start_codon:yes stop_codon:yes gene_type:complete
MEEDKVKNILKEINFVDIAVTEFDILNRLLDRLRWPRIYPWNQPSIEAINKDGSQHQNFFDDDNYLNSMSCIQCYEEGHTLIMSNVGSLFKDLWLVEQVLYKNFKQKINCNLYFGNGKKSVSFPLHKHEYAVIVKNLYGESVWIIDGKEVILKDQDTIWFDKDTYHQVIAIKKPKASLTCNIVL